MAPRLVDPIALAAVMAACALVALTLSVPRRGMQVAVRQWDGAEATELLGINTPYEARTQALWDNYWPGTRAIKARYERVKAIVTRRNKGLKQSPTWDFSGKKNLADPVKFCKMSFPPDSFYDQEEFHSCLEAIGAKLVRLNVGDSKVVTDITGAPAGRDQPDGPDSLSPGSDGWSRN